jgi:flagellar motility protein MotE (MotC chaperone)
MSLNARPHESEHSEDENATQTLRRIAPGWAWLRDNFSLPAVLSIAGIVLAGAVGYLEQRADLKALRSADPTKRLERLEADVRDLLEQHAAEQQQLQDVAKEVAAQSELWARVERVAESEPQRRKRRF